MIIGSGINVGNGVTITSEMYLLSLYNFTTFTFMTGNIVGPTGPTAAQLFANSYTSNASNVWLTNTAYFNTYGNGYQYWTVPATGTYQITTAGSRAGIDTFTSNTAAANSYGRGATISGTFPLTQGQVLTLVVGQPAAVASMGATYSTTGGGGGTYVAANTFPLIVAGGGGAIGTWSSNASILFGGNGQTTTWGGNSYNGAAGGFNGQGGNSHVNIVGVSSGNGYDAGGGGGFYSNGVVGTGGNVRSTTAGTGTGGGGAGFLFGANGGQPATSYLSGESSGGFGGGGGPGPITGGGGGGYSGGAGTYTVTGTAIDSGGGGGSWVASNAITIATHNGTFNGSNTYNGLSVTTIGNLNAGPGYVTITRIS
jgi:hypothetical protein